MAKRGHSNVHAERTTVWATTDSRGRHISDPDMAVVPLEGGATVHSVRELPPLVLRRQEWAEIGRLMGWLKEVRK
jgi:hypothetical protein